MVLWPVDSGAVTASNGAFTRLECSCCHSWPRTSADSVATSWRYVAVSVATGVVGLLLVAAPTERLRSRVLVFDAVGLQSLRSAARQQALTCLYLRRPLCSARDLFDSGGRRRSSGRRPPSAPSAASVAIFGASTMLLAGSGSLSLAGLRQRDVAAATRTTSTQAARNTQ